MVECIRSNVSNLSPSEIEIRRRFARILAQEVGDIALRTFNDRNNIEVSRKENGDLVSNVDRIIEAIMTTKIREEFPADGVFGEEAENHLIMNSWILDPIDGTTNFTTGQTHWCISIAFAVNWVPVIGVIYDPSRHELFEASSGGGALLNGRCLACPERSSISDAVIGFGYTRKRPPNTTFTPLLLLADAGVAFRAQGAGALTIAHIAAGRIDGFIEAAIYIWDCAAAHVILLESGGAIAYHFDPSRSREPFALIAGGNGIFQKLVEVTQPWKDFELAQLP
jgi:myo-inositol-1(or 4)-monophosphatase